MFEQDTDTATIISEDAAASSSLTTLPDLQRQFTNSGLCATLTKLRQQGLLVAVTQQKNFRGAKGRPTKVTNVEYSGKPVIEGVIANTAQDHARALRFQIKEDGVFCGESLAELWTDRTQKSYDIALEKIQDCRALNDKILAVAAEIKKYIRPGIVQAAPVIRPQRANDAFMDSWPEPQAKF